MKTVGEYKPKELEDKILGFWKKEKIPEETLKPRKGKLFSFLEGPPTANAPPCLHHVEMRVFKDLVNRYMYMKGYSVPRKAGWDCHGLPVEVQLEKKLDLKSKKDIVKYGVDKFVAECRKSVFSCIEDWNKLTDRMAYWIDMEDPYVTMDNDYIESVWWSLKEIHKKGLLYEAYKVVPYCPRCGTPLSSHEVALGYKEVEEKTVTVGFRAKDRDFSFLAWTTTPWTLLSNLALAVNPDVSYVTISHNGEKYMLSKEIAEKRFPEAKVIDECIGKDLVGLEYHPLFNHFIGKLEKPAWRVISGDFVTTEEGTGIVHIAPAFGEDDYNVGLENDLPLVNPIDESGRFTDQIPELKGMFAKDADEKIIGILDDMGSIVASYSYKHDYPFCWRCDTPLLYYAMKSWFIAMGNLRNELISNNKKVNWFPGHIKEGRFGDWLENVKDWSLSRNRFWGTPLPIWRCACGNIEVVGSKKELTEKASGVVPDDIDLHRPYVDKILLKCKCGKEMTRVEYVIDCWYDSGAATFAQFHYPFENKKLFDGAFPYDHIAEATDQTRGWFYTLLAISTILFDKPAYKNVVVGGLLLDDKGEKMSASKGNIIDPWELFNTVGVDAVRLQMCSAAPWNARRFGMESLNEAVIPLLRTLWNCFGFATRYMALDGFDPSKYEKTELKMSIEDRWIMSSVNTLIKDVTLNLDKNDYHNAFKNLSAFIVEDLSRWYIRLIRDRLWLEGASGMHPSKLSAYVTLSEVLGKLCLVTAPIIPFISEEIHQVLKGGKSVHLMAWPKPEGIDGQLQMSMDIVRKIFEAGSNLRQTEGIKLRYPIKSVSVTGDEKVKKAVKTLADIIKKQLNTKDVAFITEIPGTQYIAVPNFSVIGPKFGKESKRVAEAISKNAQEVKMALDDGKSINLDKYEITPDMISDIRLQVPGKYLARAFNLGNINGMVYLDTERDASLINEALSREIIRNVQELRKKNELDELKQIEVTISNIPPIAKILKQEQFKNLILSEVRANSIELSDKVEVGDAKGAKFKFEDEEISVNIGF